MDKSKANSSDAGSLILESMRPTISQGDENNRRRALLWSNSLRSSINRIVERCSSNKAIVLDVGTGDGQSLDSMDLANQIVSRILVEPDAAKCAKLCRRLGKRPPPPGVDHVRPSLMQLKTRRTSVMVANCTLGDLVNDSQLSQILIPEVRAIVSTFGIHYVMRKASLAFLA